MSAHRALSLYRRTQNSSEDLRVEKHAPLVRKIAYHMMSRLPASVDVDDLIQVGFNWLNGSSAQF
nr:sigma factor [Deefgea sp. CFH1-16]